MAPFIKIINQINIGFKNIWASCFYKLSFIAVNFSRLFRKYQLLIGDDRE